MAIILNFDNIMVPLNTGKKTSEQRPLENNDHYLGVPWAVVIHKFDCSYTKVDRRISEWSSHIFQTQQIIPGVNFINILRTHFSYESKLSSFSLNTCCFAIFLAPKFCMKNVLVKCLWNWLQTAIFTQMLIGVRRWWSKFKFL